MVRYSSTNLTLDVIKLAPVENYQPNRRKIKELQKC